MSDEIEETPAVTEFNPDGGNLPDKSVEWHDLTDSQKLDVLKYSIDSIGSQVAWIGQTFQGLINMVGNVGPMDIFKMMRGGK